jgi:RNA polymerase sigma-70 factor (ECF subfamily)
MDAPLGLVSLCEREWPRLVGELSLWTGDPGAAEDLAQETLVRLAQHWEHVERLDSPGGWVHHVAINLARSYLRRRRAGGRAHARLAQLAVALSVADETDRLAVRAAVVALPERQRTALVLRYFSDLTVEETAQVMHCPPNTVKTLTRRGLQSLAHSGLVEASTVEREGVPDAS